jgi:uncharacterized OB-fold protein
VTPEPAPPSASAEAVEHVRFEPPVGPESGPFWDATREGRLLVQWCTACDRGIFFPRALCPFCGGTGALEWREATGRAKVHAAVVEHRPEAAGAAFAHGEPFCIALVDLEEGVRMMTNVVGCPPDEVHSGMAVTVTWEPLSDGRQLALFRPATSGGDRPATGTGTGTDTGTGTGTGENGNEVQT